MALAFAEVAGAQSKIVDFAKGKGTATIPDVDGGATQFKGDFKAVAKSADTLTDDAWERFTVSSKTTSIGGTSSAITKGKVLCLKVSGNSAVFVDRVTTSKNSEFDKGDFVRVDVTDVDGSGPSASGAVPTTDTFVFSEATETESQTCPARRPHTPR